MAMLLQGNFRPRGVGEAARDGKEVVLSPPQIVEPDVSMSIPVEDLRNVSFALESPVKERRRKGGGAKFNEAKQIGRSELDSQAQDGALFEPAQNGLSILGPEIDCDPALADWSVAAKGLNAACQTRNAALRVARLWSCLRCRGISSSCLCILRRSCARIAWLRFCCRRIPGIRLLRRG